MQTNKKRMVAGFLFDRDPIIHGDCSRLLLVKKLKPEWQKGKLNAIGGKIEEKEETPLQAMVRECEEETGLSITEWAPLILEEGPDWIVYFYYHFGWHVPEFDGMRTKADSGERLVIKKCEGGMPLSSYSFLEEEEVFEPVKYIENLHWLIPMCFDLHFRCEEARKDSKIHSFANDDARQKSEDSRPIDPRMSYKARYDRIHKCPKCGYEDVAPKWVQEGKETGDSGHLECFCLRCGYSWDTEALN